MLFVVLSTFVCLCLATSEYKVTKIDKNLTSVMLTLAYTGKDEYYLKPTSPIIKNIHFYFHTHTFDNFMFKIVDADKKRFQVPQTGVFPIDPFGNFSFPFAAAAVAFQFTENPFDFRIIRKQNGAVIFSTYDKQMIFSDYYLQIATEIDSQYLYGLGQRFSSSFRIKDGKWSMFTRDRGFTQDYGEGKNGYGYFPFYLLRQKGNLFHINYLRSSNAMDVFKQTNLGKNYIVYKVIGGILDFRFFLGEQNPEATVEKINFYAGRSALPPFWSLGFHQCRWGYQSASMLIEVLQNYEKYGIPLDTIWTDIDYMLQLQDFTIDQQRFPITEMNKIRERYKWVPIIDAGIKTVGYAYEQGLRRGVFLRDPFGKPYVGKVWPGDTTFVDFFHPNATKYWSDMLETLYKTINFDGIWLDMNQLSNFCNGACHYSEDPVIFDFSHDLPYNPGMDGIQSGTVSLNSSHYGNLSEADVHVFHGLLQNHASNLFLQSKNKRPFILSRSSTLGTSKYGFHWTGDNFADWDFLKGSITDNFNNHMYGHQMVGADICGFGGDTTVQLCSRWFQLGALYPFARNHNIMGTQSQEPYALGPVVLEAATKAIKLRYSLLKHMYTIFVTKRGLGTIWKPLFFAYPLDDNTYKDQIADTQFLLGSHLLVVPILVENQTSRTVYFPQNSWYDLYSGKEHLPGTGLITGYKLTDRIPIFIREKSVVLLQDVTSVSKTRDLNNRFKLYAGLHYDQKRSNSTHKIYDAEGSILSIKDYNQDSKLDLCLKNLGCQYLFVLVLYMTPNGKKLELTVAYQGNPSLNEQIFIDEMALYYNGTILSFALVEPLNITGPKVFNIEVPSLTEVNLMTE